ncbi:hypothetical protein [Gordoniibacillus kamchatkensis]|uniref:hypothetical protein n=1 Tax=Gordoniibacillus kamchatkensis TaxID=1590651 RepID=UPI0026BC9A3B
MSTQSTALSSQLINGKDGVRQARHDILVATWSLAIDAGPDSVKLVREFHGLDAAKMISAVKPDLHFLQTHWPDWVKPQSELPGDYIKKYQNFVDQIRSVHPAIKLGVQADIGSGLWMVKDRSWYRLFGDTAKAMGLATWTGYEYHLGKYIYDEAPLPKAAVRQDKDTVVISFQKRIDEASAKMPGSFKITVGDKEKQSELILDPQAVKVDGNLAIIHSEQLPNKEFQLRISNVTDTPQYWLYNKTQPANRIADNTAIDVAQKKSDD